MELFTIDGVIPIDYLIIILLSQSDWRDHADKKTFLLHRQESILRALQSTHQAAPRLRGEGPERGGEKDKASTDDSGATAGTWQPD